MKHISNYREMTENEKDRPISEQIGYKYSDEAKTAISEFFEKNKGEHKTDTHIEVFKQL